MKRTHKKITLKKGPICEKTKEDMKKKKKMTMQEKKVEYEEKKNKL